MLNYLKMPKKAQVLALLELGWSYGRIEAETGVRRETVSRYDRVRRANGRIRDGGAYLLDQRRTCRFNRHAGQYCARGVLRRPRNGPGRCRLRRCHAGRMSTPAMPVT